MDELERWRELGGELSVEELVGALERMPVRAGPAREGHVAVLDLLRARTRQAEIVFVLGLEEGSLPRRSGPSAFLDDDRRRELDGQARLAKPDQVARDRYLFYTACTRASRRLYLVREAATDDGAPRQPSPFWDDVQAVLDPADVARSTTRRALSALVWPVEGAPTDRERVRSLAWLANGDRATATALARAQGWERRFDRALAAFNRSTRLTDPSVLELLRGRGTFGVTELETFAGCSSIWFVERVLDPKSMDAEIDARMRGSIAHQALFKFFSGLPKRLHSERVPADRLDEALEFLRECLNEAIAGGAESRLELTDLQRSELQQGLWRDLEAVVRAEAESELPLVPRRFEVSFGSERSAPELQRGLDLETFHLSGKIDRIDLDPLAARGIVWDYKSGKTAHSAAQIESEVKLQIPLYMLVLRDLVGVEPLGGLYQPLAGERKARGLLRSTAKEDGVPGYSSNDYVDEEDFWARVGRAQDAAREIVGRMRDGDVAPRSARRHMPVLVPAGPDVPGEKGVVAATVERPPTPEQAAAIGAPGLVFVSAGAGTGKTTVLVERFVRAIEAGVDVGSILVITYTDRAAAELRSRIRRRLAELGRPELTRELDGAWISTIHGFCTRLLRQYPFAAGLDPRFRVLDEAQASVLLVEAFDEALTQFCCRSDAGQSPASRDRLGQEPERLGLLAIYGSQALRRMLTGVHETLRAAGRTLELSLGDAPGLDLAALRAAAVVERGGERGPPDRAARPQPARGVAARPLRVRGQGRRRVRAGPADGRAGGAQRSRRA